MGTIQIEINNHQKVFIIRELFSQEFRNLKLEFYAKADQEDGSRSEMIVRNSSFTIGDCRSSNHNGKLTIGPKMTVAELKSYLRDTFDLYTEVYRLTDSNWQVISSDSASLGELNQRNSIF